MVISNSVGFAIFLLAYVSPFVFFNYKLFKISRTMHRTNIISSETRTRTTSLKNVSTCLLAVACLVFFAIPIFLYIVISAVEGSTSSNAWLSLLWMGTVFRMNCTFNSLIFFWKNKVLRIEGIKVLQAMNNSVSGIKINFVS